MNQNNFNNNKPFDLPPELKEKLPPEKQAEIKRIIEKLQSGNGNPFEMIALVKTMAGLAKQYGFKNLSQYPQQIISQQNQTGAQKRSAQIPVTELSRKQDELKDFQRFEEEQYRKSNNQKNIAPTFNPDIKTDNQRIKIITIALLIIGFYLVIKYMPDADFYNEFIEFVENS